MKKIIFIFIFILQSIRPFAQTNEDSAQKGIIKDSLAETTTVKTNTDTSLLISNTISRVANNIHSKTLMNDSTATKFELATFGNKA